MEYDRTIKVFYFTDLPKGSIACPFDPCTYCASTYYSIHKHIVGHSPEQIYDFAFDKGLLLGSNGSCDNVEYFQYIITRIIQLVLSQSNNKKTSETIGEISSGL